MSDSTPNHRNHALDDNRDRELDRIVAHHDSLRVRHASAITRLMGERADLRGTYAFADFVEEAVRWSA